MEYQPSSRMRSAARQEMQRVQRRRAAVQAKIDKKTEELDPLHREMEGLSLRLEELARVGGIDPSTLIPIPTPTKEARLGGRQLRIAATRLLYKRHGESPVHYRYWLELCMEHDIVPNGQDPAATFLAHTARWPYVRSSPSDGPGYYFIDTGSIPRMRNQIGEARSQLRLVNSRHPLDLREVERLTHQLRRLEAELDEATEALDTSP